MAVSQSGKITIASIQYPSFPTDRGMVRVRFDTSLYDSNNNAVEVVVEIQHEDQPIQNVVKMACENLAQEFRQLAEQLDILSNIA